MFNLNKIIGRIIKKDEYSNSKSEFLNFPEDFKKIPRKKKITGGNFVIDKEHYYQEDDGRKQFIWIPKSRDDGGSKPVVKMSQIEDILAAPFLKYDEKIAKLAEMGASPANIQMARMKLQQNKRRRIGGSQWK